MDCKNYNSEEKNEIVVACQNGGQITDFLDHFDFGQNLKKKTKQNTFPMEFFNEIWHKVGQHEEIYITEITFYKNYSILKWRPKHFFFAIAQ